MILGTFIKQTVGRDGKVRERTVAKHYGPSARELLDGATTVELLDEVWQMTLSLDMSPDTRKKFRRAYLQKRSCLKGRLII